MADDARSDVQRSHALGRAATRDDVAAVCTCLASAFHDDPLWGRWVFPDPASRVERLNRLMRFWAVAGVRHGWLRMTDQAEAVAVWVPPGADELTGEEEAALSAYLATALGPRAAAVDALLERFDEHHPRGEPHYYLSLWATHRDHAGRRLGTALICDNLARIDDQHRAVYLESTNPANISRYEKLGFTKRGQFAGEHGPPITTMWREAR